MPLDSQLQELVDMMVEAGAPPAHEGTPKELRARSVGIAQLLGPGPELHSVLDVSIPVVGGSIAGRTYIPFDEAPLSTLVYFHGGGWVMDGFLAFDAMCRRLAIASRSQVLAVDYRVAPEHQFPTAFDDAYAATEWAAANLMSSTGDVIVIGDSAGGNLAAAVAIKARDEHGPVLAMQVLMCPVVDHDFDRPSYSEHGGGFFLSSADLRWYWDLYVPNKSDRSDPRVAPLRAPDLSGLPRTHMIVAEYDPLRDEDHAYADALEAAGVQTSLVHCADQGHGFVIMVQYSRAADQTIDDIGRLVMEAVKSDSA